MYPNVDNLFTDDIDVFVHGKYVHIVDVAIGLMLISLHLASVKLVTVCLEMYLHLWPIVVDTYRRRENLRAQGRRLMLDASMPASSNNFTIPQYNIFKN